MKERSGTYPSLKAVGISEDRIVQTKDGGDHGLYTPKQQALLVRMRPSFCFNAAPSLQQAFLTIPVITLVCFHKGLG